MRIKILFIVLGIVIILFNQIIRKIQKMVTHQKELAEIPKHKP